VYLVPHHRKPGNEIPEELASLTGNRIYGCDTCQQVCPWNRFAHPTDEASFRMNDELAAMTAPKWYSLSREEYTRLFKGSAVKRAKFEGLQRNIANYQKNNNTTKI
jgi:epoxyqueuosine reductase